MRLDRLKRRAFITLLSGAAAWPLAAHAQEAGRTTYQFGFLLPTARQAPQVEAFFDELRLNGFVEGKNLVVIPGGLRQPTIIWPSGRRL
jgi:putative ABC transport system substrate-binding protein